MFVILNWCVDRQDSRGDEDLFSVADGPLLNYVYLNSTFGDPNFKYLETTTTTKLKINVFPELLPGGRRKRQKTAVNSRESGEKNICGCLTLSHFCHDTVRAMTHTQGYMHTHCAHTHKDMRPKHKLKNKNILGKEDMNDQIRQEKTGNLHKRYPYIVFD